MWVGRHPLWRDSKTGLASSPVEAESHGVLTVGVRQRLMMNEYFGAFDANEAYDIYVKNMEIYKEKLKYDFE